MKQHIKIQSFASLPKTWKQEKVSILKSSFPKGSQPTLESFSSQSDFSLEVLKIFFVLENLDQKLPFSCFTNEIV